jgi:hypothetical protein
MGELKFVNRKNELESLNRLYSKMVKGRKTNTFYLAKMDLLIGSKIWQRGMV